MAVAIRRYSATCGDPNDSMSAGDLVGRRGNMHKANNNNQ